MSVIKRLLTSRKFLTALGALVVAGGVLFAQWDEANSAATADKIVNAVILLAGIFMGATALEDAAAKLKGSGGNGAKS